MEKQGPDEHLIVYWMDSQSAPQAILDLLACNCAKKCELPKCKCMANGLNCTDMCILQTVTTMQIRQTVKKILDNDESEEDCEY